MFLKLRSIRGEEILVNMDRVACVEPGDKGTYLATEIIDRELGWDHFIVRETVDEIQEILHYAAGIPGAWSLAGVRANQEAAIELHKRGDL